MTPTLSKSDSLKRHITLHENRIELAPLKELYDEVDRLFQTKLKQEKH